MDARFDVRSFAIQMAGILWVTECSFGSIKCLSSVLVYVSSDLQNPVGLYSFCLYFYILVLFMVECVGVVTS